MSLKVLGLVGAGGRLTSKSPGCIGVGEAARDDGCAAAGSTGSPPGESVAESLTRWRMRAAIGSSALTALRAVSRSGAASIVWAALRALIQSASS
jgi:hypothetical protein